MQRSLTQQRHDIIPYLYQAVDTMPRLWNDKKVNRSGLRATFRGWRPSADEQPDMEMRSAIWSFVGSPDAARSDEASDQEQSVDDGWQEWEIHRAVDRAAVLVALRATAGEREGGEGVPFGAALQRADLSDLRLMRLLTTPKSGRLDALRRALQLIARSSATVKWDIHETRRFHDFLFGSEEAVERSTTKWAGDFFAARGKSAAAEPADVPSTEATN